jgi:bifunctional UDP-N-acetylglucosamine pyrophosphorylase/glucosamine-1-phosphate N-acetyltransferase
VEKDFTAIVLAAGEGTRMKSSLPKVLHRICGKPMLRILIDSLVSLSPRRLLVVVGHRAGAVREALGHSYEYVVQGEQLGTGHAVAVVEPFLHPEDENLLVVAGDTPLVTASTFDSFARFFRDSGAAAALVTARRENPAGYGRVLRDGSGEVIKIVEDEDLSPEEGEEKEVNASIYFFRRKELYESLGEVGRDNRKGEYYLTDVIGVMVRKGFRVVAWMVPDPAEVMGINSRVHLAEASRILRGRINQRWMEEGVSIIDPENTYIEMDVLVGRETVIHPFTFLQGSTRIGEECEIGPFARIKDSVLGRGVQVEACVIRESVIEDGARIGPYASLRPGTHLSEGSRVGTFVELKKTFLGKGSKVPHLSYMGDALIGEEVNVGAGTITCNFDGEEKHQTVIEDQVFIGSDTMLVAPVRIGRGAVTGAGSTITRDVPPGSLGVERAEQKNVENWKKKRKAKKEGTLEGDNT